MLLNIPQTIKKTIVKVVHSFINEGMHLQQKLKTQHQNNPQYSFLFPNSKYYHFYLTHLAEAIRLNKNQPKDNHRQNKDNKQTNKDNKDRDSKFHKQYQKQQQNHKKRFSKSIQQQSKKQSFFQTKQSLDQMQVGKMCQIVKQFVRRVRNILKQGLQPYTPLPQTQTCKIYKITQQPDILKQKIPSFLKYMNDELQNQLKSKQVKKKQDTNNTNQQIKKQKKQNLSNNILTDQMGISHDGTMNDNYSTGKYQGLGKTQDMFSKFRKDKSQQYHAHAYCKICDLHGHQQKDCLKKYK